MARPFGNKIDRITCMLAVQHASRIERVTVKKPDHEDYPCPECGEPMSKQYRSGRRYLVTFSGLFLLVFEIYKCGNPSCGFTHAVKPPCETYVPGTSYGTDVLLFILRERWTYRQTGEQIQRRLREEKGIDISLAEVYELMNMEERVFSEASVQKAMEEVETNGKIVLSIDGAGTGAGYDGLYVLRDTISDKTLAVEYCDVATAERLRELIRKVKETYNVPVVGVVSDMAENIIQAVREELPGVPHQYCLFHFLKNVTNTMKTLDHEVASEIRKELGEISSLKTLKKNENNTRTSRTSIKSTRLCGTPTVSGD